MVSSASDVDAGNDNHPRQCAVEANCYPPSIKLRLYAGARQHVTAGSVLIEVLTDLTAGPPDQQLSNRKSMGLPWIEPRGMRGPRKNYAAIP